VRLAKIYDQPTDFVYSVSRCSESACNGKPFKQQIRSPYEITLDPLMS